jgi:hypothetical protein
MVRRDQAWCGAVRPGVIWQSPVWLGGMRRGMARCGEVWSGEPESGEARYVSARRGGVGTAGRDVVGSGKVGWRGEVRSG